MRCGLGFGCCFRRQYVEDLVFSGYRRVVGRYTCVLHDLETSSLHIYDIYLVSGNGGQVYEGRGTWDLLPVPGALDLVSNFGVEKVITYEQTTGVAFGCPCLSEV